MRKAEISWSEYMEELFDIVGVDHFRYLSDEGLLELFSYRYEDLRELLVSGYKTVDLAKYVQYLRFCEGYICNYRFFPDLNDYWRECQLVSKSPSKYPRNYLTTKRKTSYHYSLHKADYDKKAFVNVAKKHRDKLTCDLGKFIILYPKSPKEICAEGETLQHCVASYVEDVISGSCHIVFLRLKDKPDKPLVTVQLNRALEIRQARGYDNSEPTAEQSKVLQKYSEKIA